MSDTDDTTPPSLRDLRSVREFGLDPNAAPGIEAGARRQIVAALDGRPTRRFRTRRRGALLGVAAAGLALSAGGVAYAVLSPSPSHSEGIGCYLQADKDTGGVAAVPVDGRPAIESCAGGVWAPKVADGSVERIPELQACVDPDGGNAIRVFPSADPKVCDRNGGWVVDPDAAADSGPYARMDRRLRYSTGGACLGEEAATRLANDALRDPQLAGWRLVVKPGFSAAKPCGQFINDSRRKTVTLFPVGRGY